MKRFTLAAAVLAGALVGGAGIGPAAWADAADFYRGRNVNMLVGYGPGTGYDVYARAVTRHMDRHIPGKPRFVVLNMPGAGSLNMLNHLANASPRDGSAVGMPARQLFFEPLYGNDKAKFNPLEFTWIGSVGKDSPLCFTWHTSGIRTFEDTLKKEVMVGSTGAASNSNIYPRILNGIVQTKFKVISGYKGSDDIGLAMERGELAGYCSFGWSSIKSARHSWIEKKQINILIQLAMKKHPELPDVPLVVDLVKNEADRQALALVFAQGDIARPLIGPAGVPGERADALRAAFDATMKDAAFLADAQKSGLEVEPLTGAEMEALVREVYKTPKDVVQRVIAVRPAVPKKKSQ
jgi:tripartite-type tricarboxylate transporter receptor subunit TctC